MIVELFYVIYSLINCDKLFDSSRMWCVYVLIGMYIEKCVLEANGWIVPSSFKVLGSSLRLTPLREKLCCLFLWFSPDFWFPKGWYCSSLEYRKEKIKAGLTYFLHAVVCVNQCVRFVLLSFVYANGYLSEIHRFRVFDIQCWDPCGHVHGWVRGIQVLPGPFCFVVRGDSCIHRLGRRCNVAWPRDFPSFWNKILSFYPEILLNRKVKLNKKWKEISCFEKPAAAFLIAVLTHFFGRTFDPRRETPGLGWWDRGKVWFGFPFPEDFSTTTHREYRSDPRIRLYCLNQSLRRYALIIKVCV